MSTRHLQRVALSGLILAGICATGSAHAEKSFVGALTHGKPLVDLRTRYETVDDENCAACAGRSANALTTRARIGYETAKWNHLSLLAEADLVFGMGAGNYNDTRNGKALYPVVADPEIITLNRLQLDYKLGLDTQFTLGRQRIKIGNERFVGNVGWRQHEQTFDAFSVTNGSIRNLSVTYAYIDRVNRIFTTRDPRPRTGLQGHFDSNSHILDVTYVGVMGLKLEGYAFLLDLSQEGPSGAVAKRLSTETFGVRAEESYSLNEQIKLLFNGEYAVQRDYQENPLDFTLNYFSGEAGVGWQGLTATGGIESLGSNKTVGFSTPLATLHAFNGWADLFLTTPAAGLNDTYGKVMYKWKNVLGLQGISTTLMYHDFQAARGGADFGNEWDAAVGVAVDKKLGFLAKMAKFDGEGAFRDKSVFWLQAEYKF